MIRLWNFCNILALTTGLTFDINRQDQDIIPKDFTLSYGRWVKTSCRNSCGASYFNTDYSPSNCKCTCNYNYSTFRMGATPSSSSCVKNEDIRKDSGCDRYFEDFGHPTSLVPVLTDAGLKVQGSNPFKCRIDGPPQYWDKGKWVKARDDLFEIASQYFKWKTSASKRVYSGRLVRQYLTKCHKTKSSCIVFKVGGILKYDILIPSTTAASTIKKHSTKKPTSVNSKQSTPPSTPRSTPSSTPRSTPSSTPQSTPPSTPQSTPPSTSPTVETSTRVKTGSSSPSTSPTSSQRTSSSTMPSTFPSGQPSVTTEAGSPIVTEKPHAKATENSINVTMVTTMTVFTTSKQGGAKGNKDKHNGDGSSGNDDKTLVAAIASGTVIVCVIIICVFVWLVLKRRQKCDNKAYSSNMTVITKSTGKNNEVPGNAMYCEPTDQHLQSFPKHLPRLNNPVYSKAIVHSNRAKNNMPSIKMTMHKETNHYDNHATDDDECPNAKQTSNKFGHNDYCYAEPERSIYEELPNKDVRESIYQPLIRDSQIQSNDTGTPEYLTLVNDGQCGNNQATPEYVAILPDQTVNHSPKTPVYDYALADDQRTPKLKRAGNKGLPQVPGNNSSAPNQFPVYEVLEQTSCHPGNEYLTPVDNIRSGQC